jgi:cell division protein FtsI (penicillin-binding protein 3)
MINRWAKVRIVLTGIVFLSLGAAVARRAVELQHEQSEHFTQLARRNYLKEIHIQPRRGRLLDRKGNELATTVDFDSIYCNPRQLAHVPDAAKRLAHALGRNPADMRKLLAQPKYFAWLQRKATPEVSAAVQALGLPGVAIRKEPGRVYPSGPLAATVIGHTNLDGRGIEGAELAYDSLLRGTDIQSLGLRDSYGRELLIDGVVDAVAGHDVVLTLDKYLTHVTDRAIARAIETHQAQAAVGIVMDPRSGDILAMTTLPSYDPHKPRSALARASRNRAITDVFEPGSTMKSLTFAAALDEGAVRPEDRIDCQQGHMSIGRRSIGDEHPLGIVTAAEVLQQSSNIGAYKVARRIGPDALRAAFVRFGLGQSTGIGLPGERSGTLRPASSWGQIGLATHSFGHGLTITPLQLATAYCAIASGGVWRPPRIALHLMNKQGQAELLPPAASRPPESQRRIMSEATARTLIAIMQGVTEHGTATKAALDGYPVAGKTGTAYKVENGQYGKKRVSSFVGIIPASNPRLVIAVVVDEPTGHIAYGGLVAAPAFKEIAAAAMSYLGVPPEKGTPLPVPLPVPNSPPAIAEGEPETAPLPVIVMARPGITVPDFAGMSMGQAISAARTAGVVLVPEGSGRAVSQNPEPGWRPPGVKCRVAFQPGG